MICAGSSSALERQCSVSGSPCTSSITRYLRGAAPEISSTPASRMLTMCGWRSLPASAAYFCKKRNCLRATSGSLDRRSITLSATSRCAKGSAARYTAPVAPLPRMRLTSYWPMRCGISGDGDIACEAIVQVQHAFAPGTKWAFGPQHLLRAHDAGPLEPREQRVVGVGGILPADKGLALEGRLHRLERASQAPQRILALLARLFQAALEDAFHHLPEVLLVLRVHPFVDVGNDHRQHRADRNAVDPGVEGLRHAAPDGTAKQWPLRIAIFEGLAN